MSGQMLHEKAKSLTPGSETIPAGGRRYWVAVLYTGKSVEDNLVQHDFLWIKAHAKISMGKIIASYEKSTNESNFDLVLDQTVLPPTVLLRDLNLYGDNLIALSRKPKPQPSLEPPGPVQPVQKPTLEETAPDPVEPAQKPGLEETSKAPASVEPVKKHSLEAQEASAQLQSVPPVRPTQPVQQVQPMQPVQPAQQVQQAQPVKKDSLESQEASAQVQSVQPTQPVQPVRQVQPMQPVQPAQQIQQAQPVNGSLPVPLQRLEGPTHVVSHSLNQMAHAAPGHPLPPASARNERFSVPVSSVPNPSQREAFSAPAPQKIPKALFIPPVYNPSVPQIAGPHTAPLHPSRVTPQPFYPARAPSLPPHISPSPYPSMQPSPFAAPHQSPYPSWQSSSPVACQYPMAPMGPPQTMRSPTLGSTPHFHGTNGFTPQVKAEEEMDYDYSSSNLAEPSTPQGPQYVKTEPIFSPLASVPVKQDSGAFESAEAETSLEDDFPAEERPGDVFLKQLLEQRTPEVLEAGVRKALKVIGNLKTVLSEQEDLSPDSKQWINSLTMLEKQAERKRTVVGVVGNTGAGKSSVINAMLDEERLVPTNCMRACTAVVTEMSWNDDPNPLNKYRAEIEFISPEAWAKELDTLLNEVLTENGTVSRETNDENSDAGIAWAKFHAVYPKKTKDMLAEVDVDSLVRDRAVSQVLGTTKTLSEAKPEPFYRQLQHYVDSKEKVASKSKDKNKNRQPREMEYWPLIKVVKIYTRSPALSTGAVIVDLPGVHDSNAARAAVAQGYLKQCTGLWIVAPINRAVDDKAAKTLLGDSFKRQLKYDGGFSAVTFICSKTDDISITEAADSLELDDQISEYQDQEDAGKEKLRALEQKIQEMKESMAVYSEVMNTADDDIEVWEKLLDDAQDGKTVYEPKKETTKRKRGGSDEKPKKRRQRSDSDIDSDDDFVVSDYESDGSEETPAPEEEDDESNPLTEDQIKERLADMKESKKNARRQRREIEEQIKEIREQMRKVRSEMASVRAEMNAICIAGRNEYSKKAIQQDFAAGIKEIDQETAAEEDEENFNPEEELRDYEEVARSLPVFCVSSRAYQKLCGRLVKDGAVAGFKTKEETEIPQLQAHCKKLTEAGRTQACRQLLFSLKQQLNSLYLWSCNDGTGLKLSDEDLRREVYYLNKRLAELEKALERAVETCVKQMKQELTEQIFEKYPEVIEEAANAAPTTAAKWGLPRSEGGLLWASYKATVRRDGVYESAGAGKRDFNNDLTEPIQKRLASGWERAFQRRLPNALQKYAEESVQILANFHHAVEQRVRLNGAGIANLQMLSQQITNYEEIFKGLTLALNASIMELQREANREFTPAITSTMHTVYEICTNERGPGSFMRMKKAMSDYVEQTRHSMFLQATQVVRDRLNGMCKALENSMSEKSDDIFFHMRRDYLSLIGGAQINQEVVMSKAERVWRAEIKALLMAVDNEFRGLVNGEAENGEAENVEDEDENEGNEQAQDGNDGKDDGSDIEDAFETPAKQHLGHACKESAATSRAVSPLQASVEQTDPDTPVDFEFN